MTGLTRRGLLCGGGMVAAGAVLTACGGAAQPSETKELPAVDEIPVGGGVVTADLVVVRLDDKTVRAYSRVCPHRQNLVDAPVDGVITCPAHHSTFAIDDGANLSGPADGTGLTEVPVTVTGDRISRDEP